VTQVFAGEVVLSRFSQKEIEMNVTTMPTEAQLRANEGVVFTLGHYNLWFEEYEWGEAFSFGPADSGDCGDSFPSYEELVEALVFDAQPAE
jgi:hypothetical protein